VKTLTTSNSVAFFKSYVVRREKKDRKGTMIVSCLRMFQGHFEGDDEERLDRVHDGDGRQLLHEEKPVKSALAVDQKPSEGTQGTNSPDEKSISKSESASEQLQSKSESSKKSTESNETSSASELSDSQSKPSSVSSS
jgi:hypothetical protein